MSDTRNFNCYNKAIKYLNSNPEENNDTFEIQLLVDQYYYGVSTKRNLYYKLLEIGQISKPSDEK